MKLVSKLIVKNQSKRKVAAANYSAVGFFDRSTSTSKRKINSVQGAGSKSKLTISNWIIKLMARMRVSVFSILFLYLFTSTFGFVTEQNGFIKLITRDSGTFIGTKEILIANENKDSGSSSGKRKSEFGNINIEDRIYYSFKGIPYAKPPLGKFRWQPPEPMDIKSGPVGATRFRSICSQWDSTEDKVVGSQDCLYLNIFTPRLNFNHGVAPIQNFSKYDDDPRISIRLLPVLIYIHGGDFTSSSGNIDSPQRFMREKTILVTFNYRLGIFGFLSTGNSTIPGNYGLLDQIFVLKWVKKNIHRFGGDPARTTIFGEISFLMLSPLSKGLFNQGIWMSSTTSAFTPGAMNQNPGESFESIVKLSCSDFDGENRNENGNTHLQNIIEDCLNIKPVEELIKIQQNLCTFWKYPKRIAPIIDGFQEFGVLPRPMDYLMKEINLTEIPLMIGVNKLEGFDGFFEFLKELEGIELEKIEGVMKTKLKKDLAEMTLNIDVEAFDGIWNYYFGGVNFTQASAFGLIYLQLILLFGDVTVYNGHWKILQSLAAHKDVVVFNYVFDHNIEQWKSFVHLAPSGSGESLNTINQTDFQPQSEISYKWKEEYSLFNRIPENGTGSADKVEGESKSNSDSNIMSDAMVRIWSSFASYGTPKNAVTKFRNWTRWHKFGQTNLNQTSYYHIRLDSSHMELDFRKQEYEFWEHTLPKLSKMTTEVSDLEGWPPLFWVSLGATIFLILFIIVILYFIMQKRR